LRNEAFAEVGPADNSIDLACVEVRGRLYGLEVTHIREIVRSQEVTPLPKAPVLIEGVIDLRGAVIPVIDLCRALHGEPAPERASTRIAVLEVDGMALGLRVEAAVDVLSVDAASVEEPPALATHAGYDAVRAVIRRPDAAPVLVLSIEHLLEGVYRSARPNGQGGES
jgi:purine-binding chemotaxis protein CheW